MVFDVNIMRKQFEYIWNQNCNKVIVKVIHNKDAVDYFNLGEARDIEEIDIYLNIHGEKTDAYTDNKFANILASKYHIYTKWDANIYVGDFVILNGNIYRVEESTYNKAMLLGDQVLFKEFDIVYVDKDIKYKEK